MKYILIVLVAASLLLAACGQAASSGGAAQPTAASPGATQEATQAPEATQAAQTAPGTQAPEPTGLAEPLPATQATEPTSSAEAPAQSTAAAKPSGDATGILVTYRKSGGFAGIDEMLTVHADGTLELSSRKGEARRVQVAPAELARLQDLLSSSDVVGLQSEYKASGADLFSYEIRFPDNGGRQSIVTMDGANHPPVLDQLLAELERLRAQVK